ncbi:MAG: DUF1501 domain-containing protein, partial [Candidatus Latescibacteria bacterium]|nr:DUF1501 domain-containing protein [Candidatus Latescibacterota bacterium]
MNRRAFIKNTAKGGAGFALGGFMARAYGQAEAVGPMAAAALSQTDRVLVIIRLKGGNDGLNTLVNFENDAYYQARPTVNVKKEEALKLTDTQGLHPHLTGFKELYDEGNLMVMQGVGYPNPNRSHFRSTDIWMTASDSNEFLTHGWLGRYLESQTPGFPEALPDHPLAVDIGPVLSLSLLGQNGSMGIALRNPKQFVWLVDQGNKIIGDDQIPTPAGFEREFIRRINFESLQYSVQVKEAADNGANKVEYPNSSLANQLSLVSRLIAGGLKSKVFLVSQGGYDTHANQINRHNTLMTDLNEAVTAFVQDLRQNQLQDRVLGMTMSEFGRRVKENGSGGSDHGTSAPLFFFGTSVNAGIAGAAPNFEQVDNRGDFFYEYHFRQVYGSVLNQWFDVSEDLISSIFPSTPSLLPILRSIPSLDKVDFNADG